MQEYAVLISNRTLPSDRHVSFKHCPIFPPCFAMFTLKRSIICCVSSAMAAKSIDLLSGVVYPMLASYAGGS